MKETIKILHITNAYPTDNNPSCGIFIKEQIESLNHIGIENDIFFINAIGKGKLEYLLAPIKLWWKINSKKYDIIHCHHTYSAFVTLLVFPFKKKIVSFLGSGHTDTLSLPVFLRQPVHKTVLRRVQGHIFKSGIPEDLVNQYGNYYLPNGVNIHLFEPKDKGKSKQLLGLDIAKKYILFVSAISLTRKEKRYDIYKEVISILKNKYNLQNIEELHLVKDARERVPIYFNASDLHLLVSDFEGSPNSVKESLACNVPIVSRDVGNVRLMIGDLENCAVTTSQNPEEIARLANEILSYQSNHKNLRETLIDKGLDSVSVAVQLKEIYLEMIRNKP